MESNKPKVNQVSEECKNGLECKFRHTTCNKIHVLKPA